LLAAAIAVKLTLAAYALDLAAELANTLAGPSAVDFELGLAGSAARRASTKLSRQVGPGAGEPGKLVLVRRELNLKPAFAGSGALGEDVEDDLRTVDDRQLERFFEPPLLAWRELVVKHDQTGTPVGRQLANFLDFPGADERRRMVGTQFLPRRPDNFEAHRSRELTKLVKRVVDAEDGRRSDQVDADQDRP
jgi:hypothetical protein